jgi:tetratricopeptide (TPR) repeat protein
MAQTLKCIGRVMEEQKKYNRALSYYQQSKKISRELNDVAALGEIALQIGHTYFRLEQFPKALSYYQDGLRILRVIDYQKGIAEATCNLGEYYIQQNNNTEALKYLQESYRLAEELGYPDLIKHSSHLLSLAYERKGDGLLSVKLYKRYAFMKDSIENDQNRKTEIRREVQFDFEKDRIVKEKEAEAKAKLEKDRIKRRNGLQHSLIFIALLFVFGVTALLGVIKVSQYLAEGFIFVSVLILFEFLLVLSDPYVDGLTGGIPVYKLGMNTLLAVLVFPLHTLFERKLKKRIKK